MPQMINLGSEMLRITPRGVEYSTSGGRIWSIRYMGTSCGSFIDLLPYGNEILAVTSKGIYYSSNAGRTWSLRYMGTSCGTFQNLMDGGKNSSPIPTKACITRPMEEEVGGRGDDEDFDE